MGAIKNQLMLLLHQLLQEMNTVQTILNEYSSHVCFLSDSASCQILNQWPWQVQLLPCLQCSHSTGIVQGTAFRILSNEGFSFQNHEYI